jgi:hypothetical protein
MKKQIGIWLDLKEAEVIELSPKAVTVKHVSSEIEDFHVVGGSRSKTPWGPMDKVSESKILQRRKHQMKVYFDKIRSLVEHADELYIFGPAETKTALNHSFKQLKGFKPEIAGVESSDSITENQKIAKVRAFFGK